MIPQGLLPYDRINESFTEAYNEVVKLHLADKEEECVQAGRDLLQDTAIPRYHKMKTLLLLSSITAQEDYRIEAEALWRIVRAYEPVGADKVVDRELGNLRASLDVQAATAAARKDATPAQAFEAQVDKQVKDHYRNVAEFRARPDYEDPDELEQADLKALGMTKEESLDLLAKKAAKNNNTNAVAATMEGSTVAEDESRAGASSQGAVKVAAGQMKTDGPADEDEMQHELESQH